VWQFLIQTASVILLFALNPKFYLITIRPTWLPSCYCCSVFSIRILQREFFFCFPIFQLYALYKCDDPFFFFFTKRTTSHRSGTTTCSSANIWHMPHNMYLIIRVWHISIYAAKNINLNSGNYNLYIYHKLITTKNHLTSICMSLINTIFTKQLWLYKEYVTQTSQAIPNL